MRKREKELSKKLKQHRKKEMKKLDDKNEDLLKAIYAGRKEVSKARTQYSSAKMRIAKKYGYGPRQTRSDY